MQKLVFDPGTSLRDTHETNPSTSSASVVSIDLI
jgi:hypothetical protein